MKEKLLSINKSDDDDDDENKRHKVQTATGRGIIIHWQKRVPVAHDVTQRLVFLTHDFFRFFFRCRISRVVTSASL